MLNYSEREKLVMDLYYNQGKNVREIAQEARMSFRDIGAILKKVSNGSRNGMSYHKQQQSNGSNNLFAVSDFGFRYHDNVLLWSELPQVME